MRNLHLLGLALVAASATPATAQKYPVLTAQVPLAPFPPTDFDHRRDPALPTEDYIPVSKRRKDARDQKKAKLKFLPPRDRRSR